jgi:hypothetical protein
MDKKQKDEFISIVNQGFQEVMIPALENMEERLKNDLASKGNLKDLSAQISSLDRKFEAQQDRLDRHGKQIEDHTKRIKSLERVTLPA